MDLKGVYLIAAEVVGTILDIGNNAQLVYNGPTCRTWVTSSHGGRVG